MVHHVLVRFIAGRHFLVIDVVGIGDASDLLRRAGQADEIAGEVFHVGLEFTGGVALRVDGDEDRPHLDALLLLQLAADAGHFRQVSGADGRAGHEAEVEQHRLAETALVDPLAILIGQLERPADIGTRRCGRNGCQPHQ
ncbi:hypothetical protein D9M71_660960 [compost metagenome]